MLRPLVVCGLVIAVCSCGGSGSPAAQMSTGPSPVTATASAKTASPTPAACSSLACHMTKDSGTYHIPVPDDASQNPKGAYVSNLDNVVNFTGFYHDYLQHHNWAYEPNYSWTDPAQGIGKGAGFTTEQIFCVLGSSPITTVAIIIGSGNTQDQGKHAEIYVQDDPGENSCP